MLPGLPVTFAVTLDLTFCKLTPVDNWYHTSCVGLDKTASQELESYFCARCLEWAKIKMNCFEELVSIVKAIILLTLTIRKR